MALSTISITQGTGTNMTVDTSAGGNMQVIKLAESIQGSTALVPASASTGLLVNVGTISAPSIPVVNVAGQKLAVDGSGANQPVINGAGTTLGVTAAAGAPVAVRLSTGAAFADTIPVSIAGTVTVAGTVAVSGTVAATQSGAWNVGTVASITNPVTVAGTVAVSGTPTIQGTVTAAQGTAAAAAGAWPVKLTDATNSIAMQSVSGTYAVPVKVLAQTGGGYSQQDKTAFTEGTTFVESIGGVYNDAFAGSPAAGQVSVLRITGFRAAHVNLRRNDGTEIGTATTPLVVVGNTGGQLPVSISDSSGNALTKANPLQTVPAPQPAGAWRQHVSYTASLSAQTLHTPAAGKTAYVTSITLLPTGAGSLKIFDQSDSDTAEFFNGTTPASGMLAITFPSPQACAAINNLVKWTTGTGATGDVLVTGFDA